MDADGNLVGVKETVNFEERDVADAESTKLRNELLLEQNSNPTDSLESVD
jgi:hypothetical protein